MPAFFEKKKKNLSLYPSLFPLPLPPPLPPAPPKPKTQNRKKRKGTRTKNKKINKPQNGTLSEIQFSTERCEVEQREEGGEPLIAMVFLPTAKEHFCLVKQTLSPLAEILQAALHPHLIIFADDRDSLEAHDYSIEHKSTHVPFTTIKYSAYQSLLGLLEEARNENRSVPLNVTAETNPFQPLYRGPYFLAYRIVFCCIYIAFLLWLWIGLGIQLRNMSQRPTPPLIFLALFATVVILGRFIYLAAGGTRYYFFGTVLYELSYLLGFYSYFSYLALWLRALYVLEDWYLKVATRFGYLMIAVFSPLLVIGFVFRLMEFYVGHPQSTERGYLFYRTATAGFFLLLVVCLFLLQRISHIMKGAKLDKANDYAIRKFNSLSILICVIFVVTLLSGVIGTLFNKANLISAFAKEVLFETSVILGALFFTISVTSSSDRRRQASGSQSSTRLESLTQTKN